MGQILIFQICRYCPTMPSAELGRIDLGDVTPHNIKLLKKVNQVVFPIVYHDKFYNDVVVGAVCCRIDLTQASEDGSQLAKRKLYIMTLGCLAPYRRLGIGTKMLRHVMDIVEKDGNFDSVVLHVQVSNDVALEFYKRFGFEVVETKEAYYKRIEPADHSLPSHCNKKLV